MNRGVNTQAILNSNRKEHEISLRYTLRNVDAQFRLGKIRGHFMGGAVEYLFSSFGRARVSLNKRAQKAVFPLISAVALGACSLHPVQQDVTGVPTRVIVDRIRCEARLAVLDKAIDVLRDVAKETRKTRPAVADKFDTLALDLEGQRQRSGTIVFDPRQLPTEGARSFYSRYINTAIAYDFLMQGVEVNKVGLAADPVRLITNGVAGITLGASSELTRDNQRHFAFADTFRGLLFDPSNKCGSDYLPENFLYPVSGRVGLREVVDTFIDLNEDKPLSPLSTTAKTVFADTLKFTTTLTGAATPHVQIDPIGTQFGLAAPATVGLSASRADTHTLTLGLAMGPTQFVQSADIPLPLGLRPRTSRSNAIQQSNKDAAFRAIDELRVRSFLDRAGTLIVR